MDSPPESLEVLEELKQSGYQLTPQREKVIRKCLRLEGHFTAEDLFHFDDSVATEEFSRATVYNTLEILLEVGFIRELPDLGESTFYEVNRNLHPHVRCKSCGTIKDLSVDLNEEINRWEIPFEVDDIRMTLEGYCEECS